MWQWLKNRKPTHRSLTLWWDSPFSLLQPCMFHQTMNCFTTNFQCVTELADVSRTLRHNFRRQAVIFHENFAMLYHLHLAVMIYFGTYVYKQIPDWNQVHTAHDNIKCEGSAYHCGLLLPNIARSVQDVSPYHQRQNGGSERLWYHLCILLPSPC